MAAPRKYPTLTEFNELKQAVERIEGALTGNVSQGVLVPVVNPNANPKSCLTLSCDIAERMGVLDKNGALVSIGDWVRNDYTKSVHRITNMSVRESKDKPGMSTVTFYADKKDRLDSECIRVVDGRICGFTVVEFADKKATA